MTTRGPLLAHTDLTMMGNRSPEEHIQINICKKRVKNVTGEAQWKFKRLQERPSGSQTGYTRGPMEVKKVTREARWKFKRLDERPNGSGTV